MRPGYEKNRREAVDRPLRLTINPAMMWPSASKDRMSKTM